MNTVREIEQAVLALGLQNLTTFRTWFEAFAGNAWDRPLEQDVAAGRLDRLAEEALCDLKEGRCTDQ